MDKKLFVSAWITAMDSSGDNLPTHVELTETPAAPVAAEELKPVETDASTEATKTTEEEPPATAKEEENKVETEEKPPAEKIEEKTVEPTKTTPTKSPSKTTRKTPEKTKTEVDGDSASDAAAKPAETEKTPAKGRGRGRKPTAEAVNSSPKTPANRAKRAAPAETPEELAIPEVLPSTEGKRQRKQVERFAVATPTAHEKDTQVPEGRGARLSEIPFSMQIYISEFFWS